MLSVVTVGRVQARRVLRRVGDPDRSFSRSFSRNAHVTSAIPPRNPTRPRLRSRGAALPPGWELTYRRSPPGCQPRRSPSATPPRYGVLIVWPQTVGTEYGWRHDVVGLNAAVMDNQWSNIRTLIGLDPTHAAAVIAGACTLPGAATGGQSERRVACASVRMGRTNAAASARTPQIRASTRTIDSAASRP